ncbi:unnamed protein product [Rhizophagus irregularis]|nr:unnamed protein product [Rhizophagus irregularis]
MIDNGEELAKVIKTCKERIIHVDNPPIDVEENFIGEREKIIKQVKEIKSKLPRYGYSKKLVDCSDELVEGSVGIANLIQPDNFPISNAGGDIAKFEVKILSVGVNYVLDKKENQLIEKFKNKIKEDRENQEKYLSKLNFVEKKINFPEFGWLEYIELSIQRLQEELKDIKEEKENYEETIKDWNNRRKELEEKIEKLQLDSSNELSSETRE